VVKTNISLFRILSDLASQHKFVIIPPLAKTNGSHEKKWILYGFISFAKNDSYVLEYLSSGWISPSNFKSL